MAPGALSTLRALGTPDKMVIGVHMALVAVPAVTGRVRLRDLDKRSKVYWLYETGALRRLLP